MVNGTCAAFTWRLECCTVGIPFRNRSFEWMISLTIFTVARLHLSQVAEVISFHLVIKDFALTVVINIATVGDEMFIQDFLQTQAHIDECQLLLSSLWQQDHCFFSASPLQCYNVMFQIQKCKRLMTMSKSRNFNFKKGKMCLKTCVMRKKTLLAN